MSVRSIKSSIRGSTRSQSIIVAVGGGKGGVGKSFVSANLGIFLANMGFNTVLIDLDLGAPNLHTCLGEPHPATTYHDFLEGKSESLLDSAMTTQFPKLRLISGGNDHKELANISLNDQSRLMSAIKDLKADFTILDLSAGTHTSTLDFFLMADRHLITLTPDPTSIENAYRFMKAAYFRRIKRYESQLLLEDTVGQLMRESEKYKIKTPSDLMREILKAEPTRGNELHDFIKQLHYDIVLNQAHGTKDLQIGQSIVSVCRKYFGLPVNLLGHIDHDNSVWHALRKRRPVVLEFPSSALYSQVMGIARDLASPHLKKAVV